MKNRMIPVPYTGICRHVYAQETTPYKKLYVVMDVIHRTVHFEVEHNAKETKCGTIEEAVRAYNDITA